MSRSARDVAAYALVALPGMTPPRLAGVLGRWPDPSEAAARVAAGGAAAALSGDRPTALDLARLWRSALDLAAARSALDAHPGVRLLLASDPHHPIETDLPGRPALLLAEGHRFDALDRPRVAIVGTRAATPHGLADARELGSVLAVEGVCVVSGMAIGIDGAAHEGCVEAGGAAVGVVATGLDVVYPRRHELLFEKVRRAGCLVSELPYGTKPERRRFPVRNRVIAGLADVVVVVEATLTGGARITADYALDYGRTVLAMPGSRRNPAAAGCNALIADGALPLLDPTDVLVALGMTAASQRDRVIVPALPFPSREAAAVHRALAGEPASPDQLVSRTGLTPVQVSMAVAELTRAGRAEVSRGMVWPR